MAREGGYFSIAKWTSKATHFRRPVSVPGDIVLVRAQLHEIEQQGSMQSGEVTFTLVNFYVAS